MVTFGSVAAPRGGLPVRSRLCAEALTALGTPPLIISTAEPARDRDLPWARELRVLGRRPRLGFSRELAREISRAAPETDIFVICNAMFWPAFWLSGAKLPAVWDTNECQTLHYSRLPPSPRTLAARAAWWLLERWAARSCVRAISVGQEEAVWWTRLHPVLAAKLAVVDHVPYAFPRDRVAARRYLEEVAGLALPGTVLLFLGTLRAKHNLAAAKWLLHELAPRLPAGAVLVLCGPGSESLQPASGPANVIRLGAVDDVDSVIAAADICLAPLAAGAGVKTKVLHYLAHGKRVIGTQVAFEGLAGAPGLQAASLRELPAAVLDALGEPPNPGLDEARARAEAEWMDVHHGRTSTINQWRDVLTWTGINLQATIAPSS